jgi:hypothetical protein
MSLFKTWTGQSHRSQRSQQSAQVDSEAHTQNSPSSPARAQRYPSRSDLHPVASNRSNADPFAGHLGHLTDHQEIQLAKFKSTLYDQGLYRPTAPGQGPSHDDQTLL